MNNVNVGAPTNTDSSKIPGDATRQAAIKRLKKQEQKGVAKVPASVGAPPFNRFVPSNG